MIHQFDDEEEIVSEVSEVDEVEEESVVLQPVVNLSTVRLGLLRASRRIVENDGRLQILVRRSRLLSDVMNQIDSVQTLLYVRYEGETGEDLIGLKFPTFKNLNFQKFQTYLFLCIIYPSFQKWKLYFMKIFRIKDKAFLWTFGA